jgi:hypothetical protein
MRLRGGDPVFHAQEALALSATVAAQALRHGIEDGEVQIANDFTLSRSRR